MSAADAPTAPIADAVSAQPLRCTHRKNRLNIGATGYPGDQPPGPLNAPSMRSSQCFSFKRCQTDFFAIGGLSAEAAGAHRRTCAAKPGCSTACLLNRTSSTPPSACIAMRDDTTSTDRTPSSALDDSVVCADSWMHVPSTTSSGATGSKVRGLFGSMPALHRVRCTATTSTTARF